MSTQGTIVKKQATTPWKPSSVLSGKLDRAGYTRRWCRLDTIDKKLGEGWDFVKGAGTETPVTLLDGTKVSDCIKRRNLILMEIPNEVADSRAKYYHELGQMGIKSAKAEFERTAASEGVASYGEGLKQK